MKTNFYCTILFSISLLAIWPLLPTAATRNQYIFVGSSPVNVFFLLVVVTLVHWLFSVMAPRVYHVESIGLATTGATKK